MIYIVKDTEVFVLFQEIKKNINIKYIKNQINENAIIVFYKILTFNKIIKILL